MILSVEAIILYENMKVYGPYTRKDGRQIVVIKTPGIQDATTVSYPKYLVEVALNRKLAYDETIDHIDGDISNNKLTNLRIVDRRLHCYSHTYKLQPVTKNCIICGTAFKDSDGTHVTCGNKKCVGLCAHVDGYNRGINSRKLSASKCKVSNRCVLDTIKPVSEYVNIDKN